MRPPFGDIGHYYYYVSLVCFMIFTTIFFFCFSDDRVRAISLAMGMIPVIWTSTADGGKFDTNGLFIYLFS